MYDVEVVRRRRRLWIWVLSGMSFAVGALVMAAALLPGPLPFLDKFHPDRIPATVVGSVPGVPPTIPPSGTMLVFSMAEADAVLKAMRRELTPARGYVIQDDLAFTRTHSSWLPDHEQHVRFELDPGSAVSPGGHNAEEVVTYVSGWAGDQRRSMFTGVDKVVGAQSCVVFVWRQPSWIERQLTAVRSFLHLL